MIRFLFKTPKPKQFEYQPRFYNERKEQLKARVEAIKSEMGQSQNPHDGVVLRSRISEAWRSASILNQRRSSNKVVLYITIVLVVFAYFMFFA